MSGKFLWALSLLAATPAKAQVVYNNDEDLAGRTKQVELTGNGKTVLSLSFNDDQATVELTIAPPPKDWPKALWVGPFDIAEGKMADRMVTDVAIRVNGCLIAQPWPGIAGFAMPNGANLQYIAGHWQLAIYGSEASEAYGVTYAFDDSRVTDREIGWGPDYFERTRYDISIEPEFIERDCQPTGVVIPSTSGGR